VAEMKKKLIGRGVIGFPVGIAIGYVITVIISIWGWLLLSGHSGACE